MFSARTRPLRHGVWPSTRVRRRNVMNYQSWLTNMCNPLATLIDICHVLVRVLACSRLEACQLQGLYSSTVICRGFLASMVLYSVLQLRYKTSKRSHVCEYRPDRYRQSLETFQSTKCIPIHFPTPSWLSWLPASPAPRQWRSPLSSSLSKSTSSAKCPACSN